MENINLLNELSRRNAELQSLVLLLRETIEISVTDCFTETAHKNVMEDPDHPVNVAIGKCETAGMNNVGCICRGNWRDIVNKTENHIGKSFSNSDGEGFLFFGIVHGGDDHYYGMVSKKTGHVQLLSCVGSIEGHGFSSE